MNTPLISTDALFDDLNNPSLVILDGSWHLPTTGRNAKAEYAGQHLPGARFFDIDAICDTESTLPHMLPAADEFAKAVEQLGITNDSKVVLYDSIGVTSAARGWWMFRIFGHGEVYVLNGGLPKWLTENKPVSDEHAQPVAASYNATFNPQYVARLDDVMANCSRGRVTVLDARSKDRFYGKAPEPRPGVAGGHIPGSLSLPFTELLENGMLKDTDTLKEIFSLRDINKSSTVITSCGSGVTAAIITLALEVAGYGLQQLYDGSWAEWGSLPDTPKEGR